MQGITLKVREDIKTPGVQPGWVMLHCGKARQRAACLAAHTIACKALNGDGLDSNIREGGCYAGNCVFLMCVSNPTTSLKEGKNSQADRGPALSRPVSTSFDARSICECMIVGMSCELRSVHLGKLHTGSSACHNCEL